MEQSEHKLIHTYKLVKELQYFQGKILTPENGQKTSAQDYKQYIEIYSSICTKLKNTTYAKNQELIKKDLYKMKEDIYFFNRYEKRLNLPSYLQILFGGSMNLNVIFVFIILSFIIFAGGMFLNNADIGIIFSIVGIIYLTGGLLFYGLTRAFYLLRIKPVLKRCINEQQKRVDRLGYLLESQIG
ncbi:MAG: hypothetical protein MK212_05545 [Saprospiraceae bacterium]|nr:hypothetical protein [Saprospiraceae bacterium]